MAAVEHQPPDPALVPHAYATEGHVPATSEATGRFSFLHMNRHSQRDITMLEMLLEEFTNRADCRFLTKRQVWNFCKQHLPKQLENGSYTSKTILRHLHSRAKNEKTGSHKCAKCKQLRRGHKPYLCGYESLAAFCKAHKEDDVFFNVWKVCKTLYWKTGFEESAVASVAPVAAAVAPVDITFYFAPPIVWLNLEAEFLKLLEPYEKLPSIQDFDI